MEGGCGVPEGVAVGRPSRGVPISHLLGGSHLPPQPELKSRRVAVAVGVPLVRAVAGHRPPAQKPGAFF